MQESLDVLLGDHQKYHSTLQCRRFITTKAGVTPYGMYRQALRELESRTWAAMDDVLEIKDLREQVDSPWNEEEFEKLSSERQSIYLARLRVRLEQLERGLVDRFREWGEFYAQACALRRFLKLKPGVPLTAEKRAELDRDFWRRNLGSQIAARVYAQEKPLDANLVAAIKTLDQGDQDCLLASASSPDLFLEWYESLGTPELPRVEDIPSLAEVEKMIQRQQAALVAAQEKALIE